MRIHCTQKKIRFYFELRQKPSNGPMNYLRTVPYGGKRFILRNIYLLCVSQWASSQTRHGMVHLEGFREPWGLLTYTLTNQYSRGLYDARKSLSYLFALAFSGKDAMRSWTMEKEKLYKLLSPSFPWSLNVQAYVPLIDFNVQSPLLLQRLIPNPNVNWGGHGNDLPPQIPNQLLLPLPTAPATCPSALSMVYSYM